ncbi:hypothetical protein ATANTOWER_021920, partial [Ataeniobius toweri]|nr:hypothetical protein [Ataeniobius toweri]
SGQELHGPRLGFPATYVVSPNSHLAEGTSLCFSFSFLEPANPQKVDFQQFTPWDM